MLLRPKRIVFLTGWGGAKEFLKPLATRMNESEEHKIRSEEAWVEATGLLTIGTEEAQVVVAMHPMCKPVELITQSILDHFHALEVAKVPASTGSA